MKNTLEGTDKQVSDLEGKVAENTQSEQPKTKINFKKENCLRDIWDNMKCNNIHIIRVPEGEEGE